MQHKIFSLPSFNFIGSPLRTSNDSMQDIGTHWQKFYSENIMGKIPNKIDNEVLGLYTEYEGDHTKPYSLILGCRVSSIETISDGLVSKSVPALKYAVFTAKGKMPDCIMQTWGEIWGANIDRTYNTDFEVYGEKSMNPDDAEVEIYISVK